MQQAGLKSDIRHAVDLGCSTGLSTLELHTAFPEAQITAVDLSPHFIAVAQVTQQQRQVHGSTASATPLALALRTQGSGMNCWEYLYFVLKPSSS